MIVPESAVDFPFPVVEAPSISELPGTFTDVSIIEVITELSEVDLMWLWSNDYSSLTENQKLYVL